MRELRDHICKYIFPFLVREKVPKARENSEKSGNCIAQNVWETNT